MRKALVLFLLGFAGSVFGQRDEIRQLEAKGNIADARVMLQRAARERPNDGAALAAYADFLDRYGDPGAREAYERALATESSAERKAAAARRLVVLDLLANDQAAASKHLEAYRAAGGSGLAMPSSSTVAGPQTSIVEIPGPL